MKYNVKPGHFIVDVDPDNVDGFQETFDYLLSLQGEDDAVMTEPLAISGIRQPMFLGQGLSLRSR